MARVGAFWTTPTSYELIDQSRIGSVVKCGYETPSLESDPKNAFVYHHCRIALRVIHCLQK